MNTLPAQSASGTFRMPALLQTALPARRLCRLEGLWHTAAKLIRIEPHPSLLTSVTPPLLYRYAEQQHVRYNQVTSLCGILCGPLRIRGDT